MIWHQTSTPGVHSAYMEFRGCPFCRTTTRNLGWVPRELGLDMTDVEHDGVWANVCPACGWWAITGVIGGTFGQADPFTPGQYCQRDVAAYAALANLDLTAESIPLEDVRRYLAARAEAGSVLHPRLFEETVASVFRDFGFAARVTAYSGDGGIDVILDGIEGRTIGVQVKRYRDTIKVEQIRSLVGALVINGHCGGVFVTTSDFQRGCYATAAAAARRNLPVTLVTGEEFLSALRVANVRSFDDYRLDAPPFTTAPLFTLRHRPEWCSGHEWTHVWQSESEDAS